MEKRKDEFRRKRKSMVGATNESVWKKNPYEMDEVHNERNGTENANEWWQY